MEDKYIKVASMEGLYDEEAKAVTMDISKRFFCVRHNFINGSLHWEKHIVDTKDKEKSSGRLYHISLEAEAKENFNREWGKGYGGIRYCSNCKLIDCIHSFGEGKTYSVGKDEFEYSVYVVKECEICNRRILIGAGTHFEATEEAHVLITRIAKEMNVPSLNDPATSRYGSNYYTILPSHTARLLKKYGVSEAEEYVRGIFLRGECR